MDAYNEQVPQEVLEAFWKGVHDLLSKRDPLLIAKLKDARLTAIATFVVGLDQIATDKQRLAPIRIGWRVAAATEEGLLLSADLVERNSALRLVSVSQEKGEPHLEKLFAEARHISDSPLEGHNVGLLQIPGLLMDVLLIAPRDGSERRILPIDGTAELFSRGKLYLETEFLNLIRTPIAERGGRSLLDRFRTPPKRLRSGPRASA